MSDVVVIVASNDKNQGLAETIQTAIEDRSQSVDFINLCDLEWPIFNPLKIETPTDAVAIVERLKNVDKFVFVAPEYNGGIPPLLTNFITWISVSTKDWREAFNGKKAVVATNSGGGGMHVLMGLRLQLSYMGMNVIGRQLQVNRDKPLTEDSLSAVVDQLLA